MKRALALGALAALLLSLGASVVLPWASGPARGCTSYAVPITVTSVKEVPHPRGGSYRYLPDVEYRYVFEGRTYTSRRLSCVSNTPEAERGTMRAFFAEVRREGTTLVAWVPANDPAGACLSLTGPFRYSLLGEVAPACLRASGKTTGQNHPLSSRKA